MKEPLLVFFKYKYMQCEDIFHVIFNDISEEKFQTI